MRESTLIDAHGNAFTPHPTLNGIDWSEPDEVWISATEGGGAWVPWSIARIYHEDITLEEIVADLKADSEEVA